MIVAILVITFVSLSLTLFIFGIRLLLRKLFVLRPIQVYLWIVTPLFFVPFISFLLSITQIASPSARSTTDFWVSGLLCSAPFVALFFFFFWLIRRYFPDELIFNCTYPHLTETIGSILTKQNIPFTQGHTSFFIAEGQATINLTSIGFFSLSMVKIQGNKASLPAFLNMLNQSLAGTPDPAAPRASLIAFIVFSFAVFILMVPLRHIFPNLLVIDLKSYNPAIIDTLIDIRNKAIYARGILFSILMILCGIRLLIPKPFVLSRWFYYGGVGLLWLWFFMFQSEFWALGVLDLRVLFLFAVLLIWLINVVRETRIVCTIHNLQATSLRQNLKERLQSASLEFIEVIDEFQLKSGLIFMVPAFRAGMPGVIVKFARLGLSLSAQEKAVIDDLKDQPGKADMSTGLSLIAFGLLVLWQFLFVPGFLP